MWGFRPLLDISDEEARENLARASVMAISFIGQSALASPRRWCPRARSTRPHDRRAVRGPLARSPIEHVDAIDSYFISAAEHGMNASTFTARVIASTGADVAACLGGDRRLSGPLHGGAPSRAQHMIEGVEKMGDARRYVRETLDRKERLMGFGHRVYRAYDPRAAVPRTPAGGSAPPATRSPSRRRPVAELAERHPERRMETTSTLGGRPPRLRRRPRRHDDAAFAAARRRLVRAHPRAEAHQAPHPAQRALRRPSPRPIEDVAGFDPAR